MRLVGKKYKLPGGGGALRLAKYERVGKGCCRGPHIHYWMALLIRRFHPALSSSDRGTSLSPARARGGAL